MSGSYPSMKKIIIRVLEIAGAGLTSALVAFALGRTETPPPAQTPAIVHLAPSDEEMIRSVRSDQAALLDQLRNGDARKAPTAATPATADAKPPVTTAQATPPAVSPAPPATDVAVSATDLLPLTAPIKRVKSPTAPTATTQVPAAQPPAPQAPTAQASTAPAPVVQAPPAQVAAPATTPAGAPSPVATSTASPSTNPQVAVRREHKPERAQATEAKPESKPRVAAKSEPRAEELLQPRSAAQGAADPAARNASPREVVAAPTMQPPPAAQTPAPEPEYGLTAALKGFGSRLLPSRDRVPVPDGNAVRPPMPVGDLQQDAMSGGARGGS
jgi:hypothetical protein